MLYLAILPPHLDSDDKERIWTVLRDHQLNPQPLDHGAEHLFTLEQVEGLLAILPDNAPIPAFDAEHGPYVMIELDPDRCRKGCIHDTLSAIVNKTSRITPWAGGKKLRRDQYLCDHPNRHMRHIMVIVSGQDAEAIFPFFHNHEAEAA